MRRHLSDYRLLISLLILIPAWGTVWSFPENQSHLVLSTNLLMLVAGYWLGSSKGSQDKDATIAKAPPIEHKHCCKPDGEAVG